MLRCIDEDGDEPYSAECFVFVFSLYQRVLTGEFQ